MNNEHLVPQVVIDVAQNFLNKNQNINSKMNYELRLQAIRDYCDNVLKAPTFIDNNPKRKKLFK